MTQTTQTTAVGLLVDYLKGEGVEYVFGIPGGARRLKDFEAVTPFSPQIDLDRPDAKIVCIKGTSCGGQGQ